MRRRGEPPRRCRGRCGRHLLLVHHGRVVRGGGRRGHRGVRRVGVGDRRVRRRRRRWMNPGVSVPVVVRRRWWRRRPGRPRVVRVVVVEPVLDGVAARRVARGDDLPVVLVPRAGQLLLLAPVEVARGDEGGGGRHRRPRVRRRRVRRRGQVGLVPRRRPAPRRGQLRRNDLAPARAADGDGRDGGARRGPCRGGGGPLAVGGRGPVGLLATALRRRVGGGGRVLASRGRVLTSADRDGGQCKKTRPDGEEVVAALDEPVDGELEVAVLLLELVQRAE